MEYWRGQQMGGAKFAYLQQSNATQKCHKNSTFQWNGVKKHQQQQPPARDGPKVWTAKYKGNKNVIRRQMPDER